MADGHELVLFDQVEDRDRPFLLRFRRLAQGRGVFQMMLTMRGWAGFAMRSDRAGGARSRSIQPPISSGQVFQAVRLTTRRGHVRDVLDLDRVRLA
jgi:hypothetical protein